MEGVRGLVGGVGFKGEGKKRVSVGFMEEGCRIRSGGWWEGDVGVKGEGRVGDELFGNEAIERKLGYEGRDLCT